MRTAATIVTLIGILTVGQSALADTIDFTVTPADLAGRTAFDNGQGGVPFGYDPDMPPPIGTLPGTGAPGYANTAFWSNVQGSAPPGGPRHYTSLRMSPKDIFGVSDVTISDLSAVSYWTKNLDTDLPDWQLKIYTESDVKWYGYRFNFTRPDAADNLWHNYVTDTDLVVSDIFDKVANGSVSVPGTGRFSDLDDAGYGSEKILFMDIIASYMTDSPSVDSLLDGVMIELDSGSIANINLEAVPLPAAALMALPLLGGLGVIKLRRTRRAV